MALIEDVRINGQQSSASLLPVVGGTMPLISWDYVEDAASSGQEQFDLLISTTDTNWGTDLFAGTTLDITQSSSANDYQCANLNLSRGRTYYGQVRGYDDSGDFTSWAKFQFRLNRQPFVTGYYISPANPSTSDDLELNYTFSDLDGDDQSGTKIRWFRNNIPVPTYDDLHVLPASATNPADSWTAKIIPCDGIEYGASVETSAVVIEDVSATFAEIIISPDTPNVDDLLRVDYQLIQDEYISLSGTTSLEWYINGIAVEDSDREIIRLSTEPGDQVYVVVKLTDGDSIIAQKQSETKTIVDVNWYVYDLLVNGLSKTTSITELSPILEWSLHKSTAEMGDMPSYLRVTITKTPSLDGAIYDSGVIEYTRSSFVVPNNVLSRGQRYFVHVAASDTTTIDAEQYLTKEIRMSGSSWSESVNNATGWTIEMKGGLNYPTDSEWNGLDHEPSMGILIHDGTYFCSVKFTARTITFLSDTSTVYTYNASEPSLRILGSTSGGKSFKIAGQGQNVRIYMNNRLVIDAQGLLTNRSNLRLIEYGDIDGKNTNKVKFKYFRYSTQGAYGLDLSLDDSDVFYFSTIGKVEGGSIDYIYDDLIAWTPDDVSESTKLIRFDENSSSNRYPTVKMNYSPITAIFIDKNRNKFIGTANGVTALYGDKHDPDYELITDGSVISSEDFDRISNVPLDKMSDVEPNNRANWFTIDTTYRALGETDNSFGFVTGDPYDPYQWSLSSHAVHYYTQRTFGHAWFDKVDNGTGWQVAFSFSLDKLEADDYSDQNIDKLGFGIYVNDGTYQEIVYFYEDRIRLYYANVYVVTTIPPTRSADYVISGKNTNLKIYQKLTDASSQDYRIVLDASGLFTTPATKAGNSRKPKLSTDSSGIIHATWHDDGGRRSQIMYSTFDGQSWSSPEIVADSGNFTLKNPVIDVDAQNRVWIAYEDTCWGATEISVSVKDNAGWNPKVRLTSANSDKGGLDIKVDSLNDVHVVWHDNRDGLYKVFAARWDNAIQAWRASAQYESDTAVMESLSDDEYAPGDVVEFKNPKIAFLYPNLWLVCEALGSDTNASKIYGGHYSVTDSKWYGCGSLLTDSEGNFSGTSAGILVSPSDSDQCYNPLICSSSSLGQLVFVWEDRSGPIQQLWGTTWSGALWEITAPTQITNELTDVSNACITFLPTKCMIGYESSSRIYITKYDSSSYTFEGSSSEVSLEEGKIASNPAFTRFSASDAFNLLYDFNTTISDSLQSREKTDVQMVGHSIVEDLISGIDTISDDQVSLLDSKEFSFGDFSENVGMIANWKDFKMYFGYDARPQSRLTYSSSTITEWPDDRINDLFVDAYGNVIAATFDGLVYYNTFTGQVTNVGQGDFANNLITTVAWGGNGIWYVGTQAGAYISRNAGKSWQTFYESNLQDKTINKISVNSNGEAVIAAVKYNTTGGVQESFVYVAHPDTGIQPISLQQFSYPNARTVAVDDNSVIWVGSDEGLIRIENNSNLMMFNRSSGMRSSHVNEIAIVNKHLRYVATATGIERMNGMRFTNFNVNTHSLLNNNISTLRWDATTNSLWAGSLYTLHEIIFRDPVYDIVLDEVVHYDNSEISTEQSFDRDTYHILDYSANTVRLTTESATVYLNKNKLEFGYAVDETGSSIQFSTDLLVSDDVEVEISEKFTQYHDFNQTQIEKDVIGEKRTLIRKMLRTGHGDQLLLLAGGGKPSIILDTGQANLPFATIILDTKAPWGCIEKLETLTRTRMRFRIRSNDDLSGVESYMLSNYSNFTSDGTNSLDWQPIQSIVEHDLGEGINNVVDSLQIEGTVSIGPTSYTTGTGAALAVAQNESGTKRYLFAATSSPVVIFKYDPDTDQWSALTILDESDHQSDKKRVVNDMRTINNVLYVTTGADGENGQIYASTDQTNFDLIGSTTGEHARGIAVGPGGLVYFGSSDGKIYSYGSNAQGTTTFELAYEDIGESVHSLSSYGSQLFAGTGNRGRIYSINLETSDNLIIFDSADTYINKIFVKDSDKSAENANLYASGSDYTTVYRTKMDEINFVKSYSSYGNMVAQISSATIASLVQDPDSSELESNAIISVGNGVFRHRQPAWEFLYQHDETINDLIQYGSGGTDGIWIISDTKITKWTAEYKTKKVYLRLKDKAGNISTAPTEAETGAASDGTCPDPSSSDAGICCYVYSINIDDLKDFVNEGRVLDIDEYGTITYTYDSSMKNSFYSADRIDEEIGIYASEVLNGSNDLVSWRSITWESVEPNGTEVRLQIRSGVTEDDCLSAEWSDYLTKGESGTVSIEHITEQYLQFRAVLTSRLRDVSPSLTSVTIRNLTSQASHFFTTNFVMPSRPVKGLLTANTFIPVSSDVVFGINTKNSTDFGDYQIIEANRVFTTSQGQFGSNLRIGAKLLSPGIPQLQATNDPGDPYDEYSYVCDIVFNYNNISGASNDYHFRIRFYNDVYRTQLAYSFFSGNDQTGWRVNSSPTNQFPPTGATVADQETIGITFSPLSAVETTQKWYLIIDAWNGSEFETVYDNRSYICSACNLTNETGILAEYYKNNLTLPITTMPSFGSISYDYVYTEPNIAFSSTLTDWATNDSSAPNGGVLSGYTDNFAVRFRGRILVPTSGEYTFTVRHVDGTRLFIDSEEIVSYDSASYERSDSAEITLTSGFHDVELQFYHTDEDASLFLEWIVPGETTAQIIPADRFYHAVATEYCSDLSVPLIYNFALEFELENGETVKINLGNGQT